MKTLQSESRETLDFLLGKSEWASGKFNVQYCHHHSGSGKVGSRFLIPWKQLLLSQSTRCCWKLRYRTGLVHGLIPNYPKGNDFQQFQFHQLSALSVEQKQANYSPGPNWAKFSHLFWVCTVCKLRMTSTFLNVKTKNHIS